MAKQTFTTGQVLTAAQVNSLQANDFNQTVSVKTAAYVLAAADKGTRIEFNTSGSVSCTVNTGLFDAGDTVIIQNRGAGDVTVTAGTATVNTAGSLVLSQYQSGTLYFISASASIFFAAAVGDLTAVTSGTGISISNAGGPVPTITNSMATEIDAKGDLVVGTGADTFARLAVGTNDYVLTAASGETTGLKWAAPAAGGGLKSMTLLNTGGTALTGATTITVSFSAQQALQILIDDGSSANASSVFTMRFNSDSATKYLYAGVEFTASTISRDNALTATSILLGSMSNNAGSLLSGTIRIDGTNSTSGFMPFHSIGMGNASSGTGQKGETLIGFYNASAAITSVSIISSTGNCDAGTIEL